MPGARNYESLEGDIKEGRRIGASLPLCGSESAERTPYLSVDQTKHGILGVRCAARHGNSRGISASLGASPLSVPSARIPALDGLRGLAVCLVVLFHAFPRLVPGGFLGVDLFFALSGYLIGDALRAERSRTGRVAQGRFLARRAWRLGPADRPAAGRLSGLCGAAGRRSRRRPARWRTAARGAVNWSLAFGLERPGLLAHGWSLAVELQFYLLCPSIGAALAHRRLTRAAPFLLLGAILALALWRGTLVAQGATHRCACSPGSTRGSARCSPGRYSRC